MDTTRDYTVEEVAGLLHVTEETIRRYLRAEKLAGYQLSRKSGWRIYATSVDALKAQFSNGVSQIGK